MQEVRWDDRLSPMNHPADFPRCVTGILDTACIPVADCRDGDYAKYFYSGKYHTTGLKLELTCSFQGHIIDFSFPCSLGGSSDFVIHESRVQSGEKNLLPWEWHLGDGAYFGAVGCIAKFPLNFNDTQVDGHGAVHVPLTEVQRAANAVISRNRQRVEHIIGLVKGEHGHRIFQLKWDGNTTTLASLMHVTVHMTNIKIKMCGVNGTAANGNSRYFDVVGPWPHDGHSTRNSVASYLFLLIIHHYCHCTAHNDAGQH